ncbi:MAG: aminopeptidase P family protein [Pelagimonas sp.]|jgi:Xaa-Pro aminopeptidase|nr:aminopeptidase P family protein [Pelagimonas sp.]
MFQSFTLTASPDHGSDRLSALRDAMRSRGLAGFLVPRADAFQGEYVAPHDERLSWLTGFTGSAGWAVALQDRAAVFVDGRYRVQVKSQVAEVFEKVDWPETSVPAWVAGSGATGVIAFDPWLLSLDQLRGFEKVLAEGQSLERSENLIDVIWEDQPAPPKGKVIAQPIALAGESIADKLARISQALKADACVITQPDSIAWLLNIRGSDIERNPVPHGFVILGSDGQLRLYMSASKVPGLEDHLGAQVQLCAPENLIHDLAQLSGRVQIDPATCPVAICDTLTAEIVEAQDPCLLPKAIKNSTELQGARQAHLRDGAAMVRFLSWLDAQPAGSLTEIDVVKHLEGERRATNALRDISFETISGAGPNGAIVHYRVTEDSNRPVNDGEMLLVDSGGQYQDGTTDITRTIAIGAVDPEAARAFTLVLKGMIAVSQLRFPKGLAGRDIDPFARAALWAEGMDYAHGTGHGVGSYLSVHEGPQRIAKTGMVPLEPGMILSNEPGYYKEGAFGIRIENLIAVEEAPALPDQNVPQMLRFETLTWVPIDRRLITPEILTAGERDWLNSYHAEVQAKIGPLVDSDAAAWLEQACRPV